MIYEYGVIGTFFSLGLILFITTRYLSISKKVSNGNISLDNKSNRTSNTRFGFWITTISILIIILFLSRFSTFIFAPPEILNLIYIPNLFFYFLLFSFLCLIFWAICFFLINLLKQIKHEDQLLYFKKVMLFSVSLTLVDIGITGLSFLNSYQHFFIPRAINLKVLSHHILQYAPFILLMLAILLVILTILYIMFILKRSFKFLNQYWIVMILLLFILAIYTLSISLNQLGWYDSMQLRMKLFSWQYGYFGWISLIFFSTTIFSNISAIAILALKDRLINLNQIKHKMFFLIKLGFSSIWALVLIVAFPDILNWYY